MKRVISLILSVALITLLFASCSKVPEYPSFEEAATMVETTTGLPADEEEDVTVKLGVTKSASAIGMAFLFKSIDEKEALNTYEYKVYDSLDDVSEKIVSGELSIAAMPVTEAAKLYNESNGKIKVIALSAGNSICCAEMVESDSITDLKGAKVYITNKGETSQYVMEYLFKANEVEDVTIKYNISCSEVASLIASDRIVHGITVEPYASEGLCRTTTTKTTLNLATEWEKATEGTDYDGSDIYTECIVANTDFLSKHTVATRNFIKDFNASVKNVSSQDTAPAVVASYDLVASEKAAELTVTRCNLCCYYGDRMQEKLSLFLSALFSVNEDATGGKLPDDNFYYVTK